METTDRLDRLIPWAMVATVIAVAVFAFVQSYTHVYYLGQTHHQNGASLRMLPLSVDWLMFAAGLVRLHLLRKGIRHKLPLSGLALGAIATLIANVASGIIWGWETAAIQAWAPIVLFVVVELGMLLVRTAKAKGDREETGLVATGLVPALASADTAGAHAVGAEAIPLTELRQPSQPAPPPGDDTVNIPKAVTGSPQDTPAGWGQPGGPQAAGGGLNGIGLANGRK